VEKRELAEVSHRASLAADRALAELDTELRALHARNAARGCLRSGATIKESARIATAVVQRYFDHLESFVRSLPGGGPGSDSAVVEHMGAGTQKLLDGLWVSLRKTAALASDEKLVIHIRPQVEAGLSSTQELFRSNLRSHWAPLRTNSQTGGRWLYYIELALFAVAAVFGVMWLFNPTGPYEPFASLSGLLGGSGIDLYRRKVAGRAP